MILDVSQLHSIRLSGRVASPSENSRGSSCPSHSNTKTRIFAGASVCTPRARCSAVGSRSSFHARLKTPPPLCVCVCVDCRKRFYFYLRAVISRQPRFTLPPYPIRCTCARDCSCTRFHPGEEFFRCLHPSSAAKMQAGRRSRRVSHQQPVAGCSWFAQRENRAFCNRSHVINQVTQHWAGMNWLNLKKAEDS